MNVLLQQHKTDDYTKYCFDWYFNIFQHVGRILIQILSPDKVVKTVTFKQFIFKL